MIALRDVVGFPSLGEWARLGRVNQNIFNPTINLIPFNDGIEISGILNIIFFIPFGFLLPTLWEKFRYIIPTVILGFIFSLIIEIGQMFTSFRATDINDLIMNTIGAVVGFFIFKFMSKIFKNLANNTKINKENNVGINKIEPYLYLIIAIVAVFIF